MKHETTTAFLKRDRDRQPPALTPEYKTTRLRAPQKPLIAFSNTLSETTGPVFGHDTIGERDHDLVHNFARAGECAIGQRIMVHGKVLDENSRPVAGALIEIWQANAGGRYRHINDGYDAALDENFAGCGRTITANDGSFEFFTIHPGPYPWPNGPNSWRPSHIHFSIFGSGFAQRLITQMYFEGDPLIPLCPIIQTLSQPDAIDQLTARLDMDKASPMDQLAYRFDIVLRGRRSSFFENRPDG